MCAQFGVDGKLKAQRGQFLCLVAHRQGACHAGESPDKDVLSGTPGAAVPPFFKFLLSEPLRVSKPSANTSMRIQYAAHARPTAYGGKAHSLVVGC